MERILITGGSGFIARYFVSRLQNADVILFDVLAPDFVSHARWIEGDVRDLNALRNAMQDASLVIHLAAMHHDFGIADEAYFDTNLGGAKNLIKCMKEFGINRLINLSSVAVYGDLGNPGPTNEAMQPAPTNAYGKSKLEAEQVFRNWVQENPANRLVQVRSTVVYGPHNLANVLNLIKAIDQGLYFHSGKGTNIKSLTYVENLCDAALFALNREESGELLFNYVDYPQTGSRAIAEMQAEMLGKKIRISLPEWFAVLLALPFDAYIALTGRNLKISSKRIRKLNTQTCHSADLIRSLGFVPKHDMKDGMRRMIDWYRCEYKKT
jgi:nucleoside-diphosphate-sugar epimerase